MSRALAKKEAQQQQLQQQQQQVQRDRYIEEEERHASASASAGLNLNIFGALSGAFSSKSRKTTHNNPDGSSHSVEDRDERGLANGVAAGRGSAYARGEAVDQSRKARIQEGEMGQAQGQKKIAGKRVDHLGIEG